MNIAFSPSTRAFYDVDNWPHDLPVDVVTVEPDEHTRLFDAFSTGKILDVDGDGLPIAVDAPPPSTDELAALARRRRDQEIADIQWLVERHRGELALNLTTTLTSEDYLLVLQHAQDLRDVPEQETFPTEIDWPVLPPELLATGA